MFLQALVCLFIYLVGGIIIHDADVEIMTE